MGCDWVLVVEGVAVVDGVVVWLVGPPFCPRFPLTLALSHEGRGDAVLVDCGVSAMGFVFSWVSSRR